MLVIVGLEGGQAIRAEALIGGKASRPRLVQMHIHGLGAEVEALERSPNEVAADPLFLEVGDAHPAAEAG